MLVDISSTNAEINFNRKVDTIKLYTSTLLYKSNVYYQKLNLKLVKNITKCKNKLKTHKVDPIK